ncbi:ral-GDS-related protein isoform 3, partial [Daubentonia madagascariensis]
RRQLQQQKGIVPVLGISLTELLGLDGAIRHHVDRNVFSIQKRRK